MIDIVMPFYNDSDEKWRNVCKTYMKEENNNDRQVVGDERYRDWECLKYWFRGVENNCPWVNKVFLIVASDTQIPNWLNINHPKLRIVYHRDFIPWDLLPTFNTFTIENYICKIKDLSDNYIYCNDDYFFLNPISPNMFFVDNYPVYRDNAKELIKFGAYWLEGSDGTFYYVINNGMDLQLKECKEKAHWYPLDHMPVSHKKEFESKIIDKYKDLFLDANKTSKFRDKYKISNHVFTCLYRDLKPYYKFDNYYNSSYVSIKSDTNFNQYKDNHMACFNDTEQLDNFEITKEHMLSFFENKFPNKCTYEK